jgi:hypothetical protein
MAAAPSGRHKRSIHVGCPSPWCTLAKALGARRSALGARRSALGARRSALGALTPRLVPILLSLLLLSASGLKGYGLFAAPVLETKDMMRIAMRLGSFAIVVALLLGTLFVAVSSEWKEAFPDRMRSVRVGQGNCPPPPPGRGTCCVFATYLSCKDQVCPLPNWNMVCPNKTPPVFYGTCNGTNPTCKELSGAAGCACSQYQITVDSCTLTGNTITCTGGTGGQYVYGDPAKGGGTKVGGRRL